MPRVTLNVSDEVFATLKRWSELTPHMCDRALPMTAGLEYLLGCGWVSQRDAIRLDIDRVERQYKLAAALVRATDMHKPKPKRAQKTKEKK